MMTFIAFLKKEFLEGLRSGRLMILLMLFVLFGIMNPAIAKLTPWMIEMMADELAETGMTVTEVIVDANTSWVQFFKNIPMALIVFICLYGGIFTKEYSTGTLVLILTKGLSRYKALLAKATLMILLWTAGYFICFGITYSYNAYFWDNSVAKGLSSAVFAWYLFGLMTVCLTVFFSSFCKASSGVLIGTGAVIFVSSLLGMIPKIKEFCPTYLISTAFPQVGDEVSFAKAIIVTAVICVLCIAASIPIFNKRQL